jgi:hypothetical protein
MSSHLRRFRGLAIALAVLAISAGAVFATAPAFAPVAGPNAATPTATPAPTPAPDIEDGDEDGDDGATETPAAPEAAEAEDGTHGDLVSEAAQAETPEGFANHGAWVSCVARMKDATTLEGIDLAVCEAAAALRAEAKAARAAERTLEKAERAAEKTERVAERAAAKAERAAERAAAGKGNGHAKGGRN